MYLKEIESYGFKSFADKISIELSPNINAIVGPNGSGKSNVVDAVRWVLGEGSNKSLRADSSQDVIFSGSKSRKPLNSATVNLIFDNSDHSLPLDYNEVSIKRTLYRTGDNEYYLNNQKCRLKDITDLLLDTGAAKESFNIIGQGKIDEIILSKPYERRVIFEEAAGVLKYKKRKEEALRKLERTNNNLNRINDIILELETNLEPLRIDSIKAKKYLETKESLSNVEISLITNDIEKYNSDYGESKLKIEELNNLLAKLSNNSANYDIDILKKKEELKIVQDKLNNSHNKLLELTKELERVNTDIKLFRERTKDDSNLNKEEELNNLIFKNNNLLMELGKELDILKHKIELEKEEYEKNTHDYSELRTKKNNIETKINDTNRELTNVAYKINYLEESINNSTSLPLPIKSILNNPKFTGIYNTIGNLIEVKNEYSLALVTSLGTSSNYLVVETKKIASELVNYLKNNKLGRATFFPIDTMKPRYVNTEDLDKISLIDGYINTLNNLVTYEDKFKNVIDNLLGNVLVVTSIERAIEINKILNNRYKIVTLDGQVINIGGSITGGDKVKTNDSISLRYELDEYKKKESNLKDNQKELEKELSTVNIGLNESSENLTKIKINIDSLEELLRNKNNNYDNLKNEIEDLSKEVSSINSIKNNNSDSELNKLREKYTNINNEINELNKNIELYKMDSNKLNNDIEELEKLSNESNMNISNKEKTVHDLEIKINRLDVKIDTLLETLSNDYNMTYSNAREKYHLDIPEAKAREEVNSLKNIIRDLGEVNTGSIAEYERVSERYNFLSNQREDLNKAEDTLLEIIHDMDSIMKEKLASTFEEIRKEFKKVFSELFKGGSADIYMTEPDNILETGIELEATPPGKNLKNISSLSGGERTFTAIALLFAILNVRPVPFCIFDEVEAALDDANVLTFSEYLSKYKNKTQFIIITHKKKTMEYVDTLYGITMQESGVSKLVSVKLDS